MSDKTPIRTDSAPSAIGPYSQAMRCGEWVYCSGQVALDPDTGEMTGDGIVEQTQQVLKNLAAVMDAAGGSLGDVIKTTVYLTDLGDFGAMNEVYARCFGDHQPARATVEISGLPRGAVVEIDCVARVS